MLCGSLGERRFGGRMDSCKIRTKDVMYNMINLSKCHMLCMEVVNRANPKNSRHKGKKYFFNFVSICEGRCSL